MPTHWTYDDFPPDSDLKQGDILARTENLVSLLKEVHSHFCDEKYLGFLVVSQSCDLVRRKQGECSARYITIAVVRSVAAVLSRLLDSSCGSGIPGIYLAERKLNARQLLERLVNQNEQSLGLFYLHPDSDAGIAEPAVALLRVTVSLRAEHYDLLTSSRCGRLQHEFGNKLGWLTGNLYSRVATQDWNETPARKEEISNLLNEWLSLRVFCLSWKWTTRWLG